LSMAEGDGRFSSDQRPGISDCGSMVTFAEEYSEEGSGMKSLVSRNQRMWSQRLATFSARGLCWGFQTLRGELQRNWVE
jgi:hypothetical protein